ncbi:MAG: type VI secretion system-associated protein TagF [Spongiibacteraceae bacterium]
MAFAFWRQDEPKSASSYSLFGKLPRRADFLRINATNPVAHEYDQLLANAVVKLTQNDGWESAYDATDASLFAYRSRDAQSWFVGGQFPSHDIELRRFPLVAGITRAASDIGDNLHLLPLAYEVFYSGLLGQLSNAIGNSVDAVSCRSFLEGFAGNATQTGTDFDLAGALLHRFADEQDAEYLQNILRMAYPQAQLEQALLNIAFYANFIRHFSHRITAQEIVLPLPNRQGSSLLIASVWLALIGNLAGDAQRIVGFFFRDNFIVIALDIFSEQFSPLLPLINSAKVRGLMLTSEHEVWSSHPYYAEISYALDRLISESGTSIQSIFDCTKQIGLRLSTRE